LRAREMLVALRVPSKETTSEKTSLSVQKSMEHNK